MNGKHHAPRTHSLPLLPLHDELDFIQNSYPCLNDNFFVRVDIVLLSDFTEASLHSLGFCLSAHKKPTCRLLTLNLQSRSLPRQS